MRVLFDVIIILGIVMIFAGGYLLYQEYSSPEMGSGDPAEEQRYDEPLEAELEKEIDIEEQGRYPARISPEAGDFSLSNNSPSLWNDETDTVSIEIPEGMTAIRVGQMLDEEGLVDFVEFNRLMLMFDFSGSIRAGSYTFPGDADAGYVLDQILIEAD